MMLHNAGLDRRRVEGRTIAPSFAPGAAIGVDGRLCGDPIHIWLLARNALMRGAREEVPDMVGPVGESPEHDAASNFGIISRTKGRKRWVS